LFLCPQVGQVPLPARNTIVAIVEDDGGVKLGDKAKDKITGFAGVVVARTEYLTGCTRVSLQSQKLHDGKPQDWVSFDEDQLEIIPDTPVDLKVKKAGGPQPWEPKRG
jgi:hypothetical protein